MRIEVRALTPERWPDVESIFEAPGCSVARGCWCMYYRHSGPPPEPRRGISLREHYRREPGQFAPYPRRPCPERRSRATPARE